MSAPLMPSPLDYVGRRRFSFYPPIRNADPNEWLLGSSSWSEVQVVNAYSGLAIWIPRQYVGGVSDGSGLRLVVELTKELDYARNGVSPRIKRVIEMPSSRDGRDTFWTRRRHAPGPAAVVGIKLESEESGRDKFLFKVLLIAMALSLLAALLATIARFYLPQPGPRPAAAAGRI